MNIALLVWWVVVGWCGTPWRRWPPPPTPPDPWWNVISVLGGVLGGWVFSQLFSAGEASTAIVAATTGLGAFVGSILLGNIYGMVSGAQRAAR